ncbi:MAG TPA: cupin domain-containing protein [Myxococcota bacterium]
MTTSDDSFDSDLDLDLLLAAVEPVPPSSSLRSTLLAVTDAAAAWFEPFVRRAAAILELSHDAARAVLAAIDDDDRWMPGPGDGIALFHIEAGPALENAITGFVRLAPGAAFPHHRHVGHEDVLVLQGSFVHDGAVVAAGQEAPMTASSHHDVVAGPQGCLYLAVSLDGLAFDGEDPIGPDDPRA